jgi:hypothetical protein
VNGFWKKIFWETYLGEYATMQLEALEASHRIKGTPVEQLFAMAADLEEWFPAGGTEITSQGNGKSVC